MIQQLIVFYLKTEQLKPLGKINLTRLIIQITFYNKCNANFKFLVPKLMLIFKNTIVYFRCFQNLLSTYFRICFQFLIIVSASKTLANCHNFQHSIAKDSTAESVINCHYLNFQIFFIRFIGWSALNRLINITFKDLLRMLLKYIF